jgi:molybdate transport system substrate-binding protein
MAKLSRAFAWAVVFVAALAASTSRVGAAEVTIMAANAMKPALQELFAGFEQASGHKVVAVWGGTEGIAKRIGEGERSDVVIIAAANIDKLIAAGQLAAGSRADIARSGIGIAVRDGLPRPDVSSPEAVRQAVLAAKSVAYSSGPSGTHVAEMFRRLGIAEAIKDRIVQPPSGTQIGELLAQAKADLGFQQISELLHVQGIAYLGPLPAELQQTTVYAAGLHGKAAAPDTAQALIRHLTNADAAPAIRRIGMEPG